MAKDINDNEMIYLFVSCNLNKEQVKDLRKRAGKTQEQAANDIHQSDGAYWRKFEDGSRNMPSDKIELFCLKNKITYPPF
jgi:DNA-binding XRE family transcriptional regulator